MVGKAKGEVLVEDEDHVVAASTGMFGVVLVSDEVDVTYKVLVLVVV
jgi:hypothetical protein